MKRTSRLDNLRRRLKGRGLIWFGTRATDGDGLKDLTEYKESLGLICAEQPTSIETEPAFNLERETGVRVDLNHYDVDSDRSQATDKLREALLRALSSPSVVVAYRPSRLLSSVVFPRLGVSAYWGLHHLNQAGFEYKPWVESTLEREGMQVLPWRYFSNGDVNGFLQEWKEEPVVLRISRSSGGAGILIAYNPREVREFCFGNSDGFFATTRYLEENLPLSLNGVVFPDGTTTLFPPSIQLIGISACTRRNLGFCGNDYGAATELPGLILDKLDAMGKAVGKWLRSAGYLGVFGIDVLLHDNDLYFVELNPRFLASSPLAARISRANRRSGVYIEHMAAFACMEPLPNVPLREQVKNVPPLAQVICYNRGRQSIRRPLGAGDIASEGEIVEMPAEETAVAPEGELCKVLFSKKVIQDNGQLLPDVEAEIRSIVNQWIFGPTP